MYASEVQSSSKCAAGEHHTSSANGIRPSDVFYQPDWFEIYQIYMQYTIHQVELI